MDPAERDDTWNATSGTDDDAPADLLPQQPVRGADVVASLRRDRRGLEAEAVLADRLRRLVHDPVVRRPPVLEREVEAWELELQPGDLRRQDAERFLEELLAGLVPFEHDDRFDLHGCGD